MAKPNQGEWTTGFCGCFEDTSSCCCGLFCPCMLVGRIAEMVSEGSKGRCGSCCLFYTIQVCTGLGCLYSMGHRAQLRQKYGLPEKPCNDCLMHWCCLHCSLCQEYRELKNRGWDPALPYGTAPNPPSMAR